MYPYTAYTDSFIHSAFENAAATCSGVEAAYKALQRRGKVNGVSSSSLSPVTAAPMILAFNPCQEPWNAVMTWSTSVMTMRPI